jgi:formylglycine-generating enzyme required for sulfatase activity
MGNKVVVLFSFVLLSIVSSCAPLHEQPHLVKNSIGMKFVHIPAGDFMMGSPSNEISRGNNEGPQHKVKISKGFWMGVTEVTQKQYRAVMGTDPNGSIFSVFFMFERRGGDNLSVEEVSWYDAVEFCKKLSQKEGKTYRLPAEAEWEYACRAGSTTRFSFGYSDSDLDKYGWYMGNSGKYHHSVGQKKPNAFGLYDMHGNVLEWCSDWYGEYSSSSEVDPQGPSSGQSRVVRGGSWYLNTGNCRSAARFWWSPGFSATGIGFRVVVLDF